MIDRNVIAEWVSIKIDNVGSDRGIGTRDLCQKLGCNFEEHYLSCNNITYYKLYIFYLKIMVHSRNCNEKSCTSFEIQMNFSSCALLTRRRRAASVYLRE